MRARAFLAVLALTVGCADDGSRLNVLLVTMDTTRPDRFGCYGYGEPTTPTIDQLAEEGTLFTQAFATNPITLPSHTSIMTGTYPLYHGVRDNSTYVVRDESTTLAEILRAQGYDTAAFIGAFVLDSQFNLDQGFARYDDLITEGWSKDELELRAANAFGFAERKATAVTTAALRWLEQPRSDPFFLWLHYFDPHQPINPPEPQRSLFSESYAAEIAYVDEQLGHFLGELKRRAEYERTLIIVTGDHAEGLRDHGEITHSLLVFDTTMRVPLIVRMPAAPSGQRLDRLTSGVDVVPTVLELLGLEVPDHVQGVSFAPNVWGERDPEPERAIYMESFVAALQCGWGALRGLRTSTDKLIHGPKSRLYRVADDPGEVYDRSASEPETMERMTAALEREIHRWAVPEAAQSVSRPDAEAVRKLEALGYLGGGAPRRVSESLSDVEGRTDPYDNHWLFDKMLGATEDLRSGNDLVGIQKLEQVVSSDPENPAAHLYLGKAYFLRGSGLELARRHLERSLEIDPHQEEPLFYLCRLLRLQGDLDGARRHAEALVALSPDATVGHFELAEIFESQGDPEQGREHLRALLEIEPSNVAALLSLGTSLARQKLHDEAAPYYKRALDLKPDDPLVLYNVGIWHLQGGDVDEAIASLRRTLTHAPNDPDANYVLGDLLYRQGEPARARELLLRAQRREFRADRREAIDALLRRIEAAP